MVTVKQLMKQDLATICMSTSVQEAAMLMRERRIGSVFVRQDSRIVGIVTETDIVRGVVADGRSPFDMLAREIMSSPVIGIDGARSITEAAELMERNRTRHLAVMRSGDIVGVVSVRDLLHPVAIDEF